MSRIIIFLQDINNYSRGEVVSIVEDDHILSELEGPPKFGIINCPEITTLEAKEYPYQWEHILDFNIIASDASIDGFRIDLTALNPGVALEGGITAAKASTFLTNWGAAIVTSGANLVRFDVTIQDAYKSKGFWDADPVQAGVIINETQYVQGTGLHRATIDVSGSNLTTSEATNKVGDAGGTVTDITGDVLSVEFTRAGVRNRFFESVDLRLKDLPVALRRFFFLEADIQILESNGGEMTLTQAQVLARIQDKSA